MWGKGAVSLVVGDQSATGVRRHLAVLDPCSLHSATGTPLKADLGSTNQDTVYPQKLWEGQINLQMVQI